jgi:hypothetical protein
MPMSHSLPPRPTLLTTAVLAGPAQGPRPAPANADRQAKDATTPVFYILLSLIIVSLVLGVFPQY